MKHSFFLLDKNQGFPGRKPNLYWRYKPGKLWPKRIYEKCAPGVKAREAQRVELTRQIQAGTWVHPLQRRASTINFAAFAMQIIQARIDKGVGKNESPPNKTERGHVVNHLIPAFGHLTLPELAVFKVIKNGFDGALGEDAETRATRINHKGLSGRMVRNIHTTLRTILLYAEDENLIDNLPPPLQVKRDHLPAPIDRDPEWRPRMKYARSEVVALAKCEPIPAVRRTQLLTYFCTGPRYMELARQKVRHYDRDMMPLHSLTVSNSKAGRHAIGTMRHIPVLPELQLWLDWYLDEEYERVHGKPPEPDDYLFPPYTAHGKSSGKGYITHNAHAKQLLMNDLPMAGLQSKLQAVEGVRLRERGIHAARKTFISLWRSASERDDLLRALTHKGTDDSVLDAYTHWEWKALCDEISKIRYGLPLPPYRSAPPIQLVPRGYEIDAGSDSSKIIALNPDASGTPRRQKHRQT